VVTYVLASSQRTIQVTKGCFLWVTLKRANNNTNMVLVKKTLSTGSHTPSNHHRDSMLCQPLGEKTGLVPQGRDKLLFCNFLLLFINIK